jgi:hypothetical protein
VGSVLVWSRWVRCSSLASSHPPRSNQRRFRLRLEPLGIVSGLNTNLHSRGALMGFMMLSDVISAVAEFMVRVLHSSTSIGKPNAMQVSTTITVHTCCGDTTLKTNILVLEQCGQLTLHSVTTHECRHNTEGVLCLFLLLTVHTCYDATTPKAGNAYWLLRLMLGHARHTGSIFHCLAVCHRNRLLWLVLVLVPAM